MFKASRVSRIYSNDCAKTAMVRGAGAILFALLFLMTDWVAAAQHSHVPDDVAIAKALETYFAAQPGYQKGDLITRSQIEKILAKLQAVGVKLNDASGIAKRGLADDSFLVRELATADGRRFMRKIGDDPGTYARLDRLSTIPRGQQTVRDMVRMKDGDKLVQYMATTKGGRNMGSMLAGARGGVDLNKPTGRIYTAEDLIAAIKAAIAKP
jgi:hypothetical protein